MQPGDRGKPWSNRVSEMLGCTYPIISGPMRLISLGKMAACVSNAGGFGVVAASGLSPEELVKELKKARSLTDRPIGVNIPVYRPNAMDALEIAIDMGIEVVYTSAGNPAKMIDKIKTAGMKLIHKISSLDMARKAQAAGVDGVVAMGVEAGGHIGREGMTTFCLVPILARELTIPVIASGGIGDARGFLAALALGAEGVEIGTRLVATRECPVPKFFKTAVCSASGNATIVLGKDAMPIRVLKNTISAQVAGLNDHEADQTITARGDAHYVADGGTKDTAVMPCGQVSGLVREIGQVKEVLDEMVSGAGSLAGSLDALAKGGLR